MNHIKEFNSLWQDFMVKLQGQILKRSAEGLPSCNQLNIILTDCALDWMSKETICGRWFLQYERENPRKAEMIRQILTFDMHFRPSKARPELPGVAYAVIPVTGAVAGLALSRTLGAGIAIQAASAIVPAVALSPAMKYVNDQIRGKNTQMQLDEYLLQLNDYYRSILSVLENE